MNRNIWGIALALIGALALALAACGGGGGTDPGNNGGGSGGNAVEPLWLTVEVELLADTVNVDDAMISLRWNEDGWDTPIRYADFKASPPQLDMNMVSPYNGTPGFFKGISVKVEAPGLYANTTDFVNAEALKASGDTYHVRIPVARDLNGAGWTCTYTRIAYGVPDPSETKPSEVTVGRPYDQPYAEHFIGDLTAFGSTYFEILGDRISGTETDNGQEIVMTGTAASTDLFDYEKKFMSKDVVHKYHCER